MSERKGVVGTDPAGLFHHKQLFGVLIGREVLHARSRLGFIKAYFKWLCRQNHLMHYPASELELPREEKRLPQEPLSIRQVESVLNVPDIRDPLGVRDRAILEVFYSTGIRRAELTRLSIEDLNQDRMTLQVRQGKGKKDRVVPIGGRALA